MTVRATAQATLVDVIVLAPFDQRTPGRHKLGLVGRSREHPQRAGQLRQRRDGQPSGRRRTDRRRTPAVAGRADAQSELGVAIPVSSGDYERVLDQVDLDSIAAQERVTRHDVKARIEEFNALASHEHVHKGMTSRDLTENVERLQIRRSLERVFSHGVAVVAN